MVLSSDVGSDTLLVPWVGLALMPRCLIPEIFMGTVMGTQ